MVRERFNQTFNSLDMYCWSSPRLNTKSVWACKVDQGTYRFRDGVVFGQTGVMRNIEDHRRYLRLISVMTKLRNDVLVTMSMWYFDLSLEVSCNELSRRGLVVDRAFSLVEYQHVRMMLGPRRNRTLPINSLKRLAITLGKQVWFDTRECAHSWLNRHTSPSRSLQELSVKIPIKDYRLTCFRHREVLEQMQLLNAETLGL